MKALGVSLFLFVACLSAIQADEVSVTVGLFDQAKQVALSEVTQSKLRQKITQLLQSSSLNSASDRYRQNFPFTGVQQDYRDSVAAGDYLLVTMSPEQTFDTHGGEISATEIVVGLKCPGSRNCVFTIDKSGRITSYAKYYGEVFLELKQLVSEARN